MNNACPSSDNFMLAQKLVFDLSQRVGLPALEIILLIAFIALVDCIRPLGTAPNNLNYPRSSAPISVPADMDPLRALRISGEPRLTATISVEPHKLSPADPLRKGKQTSNVARTFSQKLLFVNHDAQNMEVATHRERVFSHIQSNYRKWKRGEDNKEMRASIKLPSRTFAVRGERLSRDGHDDHQVPVTTSTKYDSRQLAAEIISARHEIQGPGLRLLLMPETSAQSVVKQGNSDPFDCFAVKISPIVNSMLSFYRQEVITSIFNKSTRDELTGSETYALWHHVVDGLQDAGASYGVLACAASLASRTALDSKLNIYATSCRKDSLASLRRKLTISDDFEDPSLVWHVKTALTAELYDENFEGAEAHTRWISHQFEKRLGQGPLDLGLITRLVWFLYINSQHAVMSLSRTGFHLKPWVLKATAQVNQIALTRLPGTVREVHVTLNAVVEEGRLRDLLIGVRKYCAVWFIDVTHLAQGPDLILLYCVNFGWVTVTGLIDHYLIYADAAASEAGDLDDIYAQQYLALSGLYWLWLHGSDSRLFGRPIFDGAKLLTVRLRQALQASERPMHHAAWSKYKDGRLFAFFIGALIEHRHRFRFPDPARAWSTRNFIRHADDMGLSSWSAVQIVLESFTFESCYAPDCAIWFQDAWEAYFGNSP